MSECQHHVHFSACHHLVAVGDTSTCDCGVTSPSTYCCDCGKVTEVGISIHITKVGLSWSDDSVTLICTREECMEQHLPPFASPASRPIWWQREVPYMATPEQVAELRDKHIRGEW